MEQKKWYASKTLWTNIAAIAAIILQGVTGKEVLSAETQVAILGGVNVVLRLVTREEVVW